MHEDVAELARQGRLVEAGELATAHGELRDASALFERACAWDRAASVSLAAGDAGEALRLAALAGADETADAALEEVARRASSGELVTLADALRRLGQYAWAARTFERAGANADAALAWERAGDALRAARLVETGKDGTLHALRVLDGALRRDPDRADVRVALGAMLLRCGKAAAALRAVQPVPEDSPVRREALDVARAALIELGMNDGRAAVDAELSLLGGSPRRDDPRPLPVPRDGPLPARLYGRYDVVREVSSTATARLLECEDTLRGERVALKIFSAEGWRARGAGRDALARFSREARVLGELAHPNIVPLRDVIEQGPALVLAWMPGGTLEEHLAAGAFAPARAVHVARSVLRALGEAHRIGVLHRDIKPANVLFDAAGTARLADFGVAHLGDLSVTATAGVFGTLAYMSPEQREGRPATARSDLFGVGVVLLEMLMGARPIAEDGGPATVGLGYSLASVHRHMGTAHDAVTRALVARDPLARPADAFEAARSLASLAWPTDLDPARELAPRAKPASVHPPAERLVGSSATVAYDRWLERSVDRVPLNARSLARAVIFARIGHRALQPILRVDREASTLWLGVPHGEPLARPLSQGEREVLGHVLALLHAEGGVHGSIDRSAVVVGRDGPVLRFPSRDECEGSPELDRAALSRL
jgi:serine/threonine protein kinase